MCNRKGFNIEPMESFPPKENPYLHDYFHMGTQVGNNLEIMYSAYDSQEAKYIIIVNKTTGERIKVTIKE